MIKEATFFFYELRFFIIKPLKYLIVNYICKALWWTDFGINFEKILDFCLAVTWYFDT